MIVWNTNPDGSSCYNGVGLRIRVFPVPTPPNGSPEHCMRITFDGDVAEYYTRDGMGAAKRLALGSAEKWLTYRASKFQKALTALKEAQQ